MEIKKANFDRLWSNATRNLVVIDFPDAAKQELLKFRSPDYPTYDPESENGRIAESPVPYGVVQPRQVDIPPNIKLRGYQNDAIGSWESNGYQGVFSMATGTGKTITALASLVSLYKKRGNILAFVTCPYKHLVNQWVIEAKRFGFKPIVAFESHLSWEEAVNTAIVDFKAGARDNVFVVTTHSTFSSETMQSLFETIRGNAVFVADEMHHLGASQNRKRLPRMIPFRLGLSATPKRWLDDEGTQALEEYFGKIIYDFPLERAINEGYLTEYYYYPVLVHLNENELRAYYDLTRKIAQVVAKGAEFEDEVVELLLLKRADLLNNAESKIDALSRLISRIESVSHTLVYCTPEQLGKVVKLLGSDFNIRVSQFTYRESATKRKELLDSFAAGELQALAAIRCLDEGVDIPSTRTAFILASSGNPREFIQRRGRILRKSPGKQDAEIYDFLTVSTSGTNNRTLGPEIFSIERKILKKELLRFKEFAQVAKNSLAATREIIEMAGAYGILDY